jgi:transposase
METIKIQGEVVAVDVTVHMAGGRYVAMLLEDKEIVNKVFDAVQDILGFNKEEAKPAKVIIITNSLS